MFTFTKTYRKNTTSDKKWQFKGGGAIPLELQLHHLIITSDVVMHEVPEDDLNKSNTESWQARGFSFRISSQKASILIIPCLTVLDHLCCRRYKSSGMLTLRLLTCWDCGFESHRGHGYLSVVSVGCCQVEVSATSWSLIQRSPTDCGASLCVI